jgi:SnoaL-like protein
MKSLKDTVAELNRLVADKKLVEGIDRFYADDVVMAESSAQSTTGKAANRERERAFVDGLTKWSATLHDTVVDEERGLALNRWTIEFDHRQFGAGVLRQIAAQTWRDGQIVHEAFYKQ